MHFCRDSSNASLCRDLSFPLALRWCQTLAARPAASAAAMAVACVFVHCSVLLVASGMTARLFGMALTTDTLYFASWCFGAQNYKSLRTPRNSPRIISLYRCVWRSHQELACSRSSAGLVFRVAYKYTNLRACENICITHNVYPSSRKNSKNSHLGQRGFRILILKTISISSLGNGKHAGTTRNVKKTSYFCNHFMIQYSWLWLFCRNIFHSVIHNFFWSVVRHWRSFFIPTRISNMPKAFRHSPLVE